MEVLEGRLDGPGPIRSRQRFQLEDPGDGISRQVQVDQQASLLLPDQFHRRLDRDRDREAVVLFGGHQDHRRARGDFQDSPGQSLRVRRREIGGRTISASADPSEDSLDQPTGKAQKEKQNADQEQVAS